MADYVRRETGGAHPQPVHKGMHPAGSGERGAKPASISTPKAMPKAGPSAGPGQANPSGKK
jgi:hypothetical protein